MVTKETREAVAELLNQLANGESVVLGEFSDNAEPATEADEQAEHIRELAAAELRAAAAE